MNHKEIITANLDQLLTSTVVSGELAIAALQKGIITQGEFQQLNAPEVSCLQHFLKYEK